MRRGGARSFVDDLVLSRGVVRSRAVYCCDLLRLSPLTRRFVRYRRTDLLRLRQCPATRCRPFRSSPVQSSRPPPSNYLVFFFSSANTELPVCTAERAAGSSKRVLFFFSFFLPPSLLSFSSSLLFPPTGVGGWGAGRDPAFFHFKFFTKTYITCPFRSFLAIIKRSESYRAPEQATNRNESFVPMLRPSERERGKQATGACPFAECRPKVAGGARRYLGRARLPVDRPTELAGKRR